MKRNAREVINFRGIKMKIADLLIEMIKEELEEAGAVGDSMTMNMIHGVLNNILAKHGGDYEAASSSPEWQIALKNGEAARTSSVASQQQQAAAGQQKGVSDIIGRLRARLAPKKQQTPAAPVQDKRRQELSMAKTQKMPENKLAETVRKLVREALEEAKKNG